MGLTYDAGNGLAGILIVESNFYKSICAFDLPHTEKAIAFAFVVIS
jgi:hypothetical protein